MEKTKTHWKENYNYDYLGAYSLSEDEEVVFTIKSIAQQLIKNTSGKDELATVVHFVEPLNKENKPMILNKTNCKAITKAHGTPYIEEWVDKKVTIYVKNGIKAFGDIVSALRVRDKKPELPVLVLDSENYKKAVTYMGSKGASIEAIKTKYQLSKDVETKLKAI